MVPSLGNQAKETGSWLSEHRKRKQGLRDRWTSKISSRMNQKINIFVLCVVCILWNGEGGESGAGVNLDKMNLESISWLDSRYAATSA